MYLILSFVYCYHSIENTVFPEKLAKLDSILFKHAAKTLLQFSLFAHAAEALYVSYKCQTILDLPLNVTVKWFIIVFFCGYAFFVRFQSISSFVATKKPKNIDKKI
jgi:hypothetical protein